MLTTDAGGGRYFCDMKKVARIHQSKRPIRRHFIKEWMEARGLEPTDIIEQLDADRSTVYRWLAGQLPQPLGQARLAALFEIEPEDLLRHPDDDWLSRFFAGRDPKERERIKQAMELAWPPKTGTGE